MVTPYKQWKALSIDEKKSEVIAVLSDLSKGGRGVSMSRFDNQKPHWIPGSVACRRLFGGWPEANVAAGLTPLRKPGADRNKGRLDDTQMGKVVTKLRREDPRDAYKRPLVVVCSDFGEKRRYYDPNLYCWRTSTVYKCGRFDNASA